MLQIKLPTNALPVTYKLFITAHLDYGDILYHQTTNDSFSKKQLENIWYKVPLAITEAIKGTS